MFKHNRRIKRTLMDVSNTKYKKSQQISLRKIRNYGHSHTITENAQNTLTRAQFG